MRTCRGTATVFLLAAIIMVVLMIGNTGRSCAISHMVDFDHGSVTDTIGDGGELIKEIGDGIVRSDDDLAEEGGYDDLGETYDKGGREVIRTGDTKPSERESSRVAVSGSGEEETDLSVTGRVEHTPGWDKNRSRYNTYAAERNLSERGENVFWPGEVLVLTAGISGSDGAEVTAEFAGTGYTVKLSGGGREKRAEVAMNKIPGAEDMESLTVRFTAEAQGITAEAEDTISIDDSVDYWFLHRKEAP